MKRSGTKRSGTKRVTAAVVVGAAVALVALAITPAGASHRWSSYHWRQPSSTILLKYNANLTTTTWQTLLDGPIPVSNPDGTKTTAGSGSVISKWDSPLSPYPDRLDFSKGANNVQDPKQCKAKSGTVQVCNARYGQNGWLGIAQIWTSGGHIVQALTKVNDTYFDSTGAYKKYNDDNWRRMVLCQEIGHDFGLDHQDEAFDNTNLGTCMDYTSTVVTASGDNRYPNAHDFEELACIYNGHDYTTSTSPPTAGCSGTKSGTTAKASAANGNSTYVEDLGNGRRLVTHVLWVDPSLAHGPPF